MTGSTENLFERLREALGAQYHLEREIGRGGMGIVFRAHDVVLERPVAVKVVHPELAAHESIARRFLGEARTIARIRHPNIVTVHAAGNAGGLLWYVMDEVPGESLRDRLAREGRLAPDEAARIVADLAGALNAAGSAGVVHRDVKPENVLLDAGSGRALLSDFGIARVALTDPTTATTGRGIAIGTPAYMSPEQATGEEVDARSDIYALGIVAYEMVAGHPPFEGPGRVVVSKHLAERPTPLSSERPDCPPALAAAIMRALEKPPSARWQTGSEFREAVRGERPTPVPARPALRRRASLAAAGVLLGALGVAALAARDGGGPPAGVDPRHSLLVLPFSNVRNDARVAWLRDASVSMLSLNLSQWDDLTVIDHERLHDLLGRHGLKVGDQLGLETARRLARDAGVWTVVLGEYTQVGDSLHVAARLYDVETGRRIDVAQVAGVPGEDARPLFDELAARLLDLSGAPQDISTDLAQATTGSLEAFRAYLGGVEHLSDWDLAAAEREFRKAVALDTTFGLAYYKLALTRGWLVGAEDSASRRAMVRAVRYSERLPEHERTIIAAYHAFLSSENAIARELYERLIARNKHDADAWYGLGEAWFHSPMGATTPAEWTRALRAFKSTLELDPDYTLAYDHIQFMLTSASSPQGWLALLPNDSLIAVNDGKGQPRLSPPAREAALERAQEEAVRLARAWVGSQPTAMRAHGALVDAYLAAGDWAAARREVDRYRELETEHPEEPFLDARISLAAGEPDEAATTLRRALDSVAPADFRQHEGTPTVLHYVRSAANVFAYQGDLGSAARAIDFADRVQQTVFPEFGGGAMADHWRRQALGELYAAAGGPAGTLRNVWSSAEEASRSAPPDLRDDVLQSGATAALGLFIGPAGDSTAIREFQLLTGQPLAREIEALLALSREDTAGARRLLSEPDSAVGKTHYIVYRRPIAAQIHFELGEYDRTLELLDGFEPEMLSVHGFDSRWALVGRVRLLRGAALEKLGRPDEANAQYRLALDQWKSADPAIEPYVRQAQAGVIRTTPRGVG